MLKKAPNIIKKIIMLSIIFSMLAVSCGCAEVSGAQEKPEPTVETLVVRQKVVFAYGAKVLLTNGKVLEFAAGDDSEGLFLEKGDTVVIKKDKILSIKWKE